MWCIGSIQPRSIQLESGALARRERHQIDISDTKMNSIDVLIDIGIIPNSQYVCMLDFVILMHITVVAPSPLPTGSSEFVAVKC